VTQRDWIEKDFYRELGVASGASADEIKKAYRKLARELHPDANPGDAQAEARFKAVSEAYGVLSDEKKRREYDETRALFAGGGGFGAGGFPGGFGSGAAGQGFDLNDLFARAGTGGAPGAGGLGDLFGGLFGNRGAGPTTTRSQRGADVESELRIDFVDAVRGAEVQLRLTSPGRCERCGGTGSRPGSTPRTLTVPVTYPELVLGSTVTVPTLDSTVSLRIPAGTASGRTFRVRGLGVQRKSKTGDLLVTVEVAVPSRLDDKATEALQSYAEATKEFDPRADLLGGAR
jgi:DnaJ-class molecular chaperone